MNALTFRLRLLEPVLVSQTETGEENSAIGLSFIPGSALRGAFVDLYLRAYPTADPATDPQAKRLFFDHSVCFLNAYPWVGDCRLLPKPMSWFVEKDEIDREYTSIYDFAIDDDPLIQKPKPPPGDFCRVIPASEELDADPEDPFAHKPEKRSFALFHSPARHLGVHISLEDANYRGQQNKVYRYEALAEGEVLAGVVISEDASALELLRSLLAGSMIRIGRAHTAGYGRVGVEDVGIERDWDEYGLADEPEDGRVVVTLLSDIILRGKGGQNDSDLDDALACALKLPALKAERAFRYQGLVGGFNRKWSLPLTQSWALKAGCVYVYRSRDVDATALWVLAQQGIGERRSEGFGRFAVNWHTNSRVERTRQEEPVSSLAPLSEGSIALARRMAQRRLRLLLDRKLTETVNKTELNKTQPQNAQLSRVRNAARESLMKGSLTPVADLLSSLKSAREQFVRARTGSAKLLDWIRDRATKQDVETELLESSSLPSVAGEKAELTVELKVEYTARLIDGMMKKAIRQNQERDGIRRSTI